MIFFLPKPKIQIRATATLDAVATGLSAWMVNACAKMAIIQMLMATAFKVIYRQPNKREA